MSNKILSTSIIVAVPIVRDISLYWFYDKLTNDPKTFVNGLPTKSTGIFIVQGVASTIVFEYMLYRRIREEEDEAVATEYKT
jgi:hypothetical protein